MAEQDNKLETLPSVFDEFEQTEEQSPDLDSGLAVFQQFDDALATQTQKRTQFEAFDALQTIDLRREFAAEDGVEFNLPEVSTELMQDFNQGTVKGKLNEAIEEDRRRTLDLESEMIVNSIKAGDISTAASVASTGVMGFSPSDPLFVEARAAEKNRQLRMMQEEQARFLNLLATGTPPDIVDSYVKDFEASLEEPLLGNPVDIVTDLVTGAFLVKGAIKVGEKITLKALSKSMSRDVFYGQAAAGFMTYADLQEAGPVMQTISGIAGPTVAMGILQLNRNGLKLFLRGLKESRNLELYRDLSKAVEKGDDKFSSTARELFEEINAGVRDYEGNLVREISPTPIANTARLAAQSADGEALKKVADALVSGSFKDHPLGELSLLASGTGMVNHHTLFPEEVFAATRPIMDDMSGMLGDVIPSQVVREELTSLDGRTDLAQFFNEVGTIRSNAGNTTFHEITKNMTPGMEDVINARIYKDNSLFLGDHMPEAVEAFTQDKKGLYSLLGVGKRVFTPDVLFREMSHLLVNVPTAQLKFQRSMEKTTQEILDRKIFKGLSDTDSRSLTEMLQYSTDINETLRLTPGGLMSQTTGQVFSVPDKVIKKYFDTRYLMENFYSVANQTSVNVLKGRGYQALDNQFVVDVVGTTKGTSKLSNGIEDIDGVTWSKELADNGWKAARIVDAKNPNSDTWRWKFLSPTEQHRLSEIPDDLRVLPYREGYFPIMYDKADTKFAVHQVRKEGDNWSVNRLSLADTRMDAEDAVKQLRELDPASQFFFLRNNEQLNLSDIGLDSGFDQIIRRMGPEEIRNLAAQLSANGVENIDALIKYAKTFSYQKPAHFKGRAAQRLKDAKSLLKELETARNKQEVARELFGDDIDVEVAQKIVREAVEAADDAPLVPTQTALASYVRKTSEFINFAELNDKAKAAFVNKYASVLLPDESGVKSIRSPIDLRSQNSHLAFEASEVQSQILRGMGMPTPERMKARIAARNRADRFYDGKYKYVGALMDRYLKDGFGFTSINALKKLGTHVVLGMMNLGQFAVQQTVILNAFKYGATNPKALTDGFQDFNDSVMHAMVGRRLGIKPTDHQQYLRDILKKSGFTTGIDFDYADQLMNTPSLWSGQTSSVARKALNVGLMPMKGGETFGRGVIWYTERRNLISEIEQGLHPNLKKAGVDSDSFLREVNIRAESTSGNFTKFNKAFLSRDNVLSVMLQFMSYPLFQTQFQVLGKNTAKVGGQQLSLMEHMGVMSAWMGAFGFAGLPFVGDVATAIELFQSEILNDPTAVDKHKRKLNQIAVDIVRSLGGSEEQSAALSRFIRKGLANSLTGGELDLASRAAMGDQFSRFLDGLDYTDLAGVGPQALYQLTVGNVRDVKTFYNLISNGELLTARGLRAVGDVLQPVRSVQSFTSAASEDVRNRRGEIVLDNPTLMQRISIAAGIKPGAITDNMERRFSAQRTEKAAQQVVWEDATYLASLIKTPETYKKELARLTDEYAQTNPLLLKELMSRVVYVFVQNDLPPEAKTFMIEWAKYKTGGQPLFFDLDSGGANE